MSGAEMVYNIKIIYLHPLKWGVLRPVFTRAKVQRLKKSQLTTREDGD